MKNRMRESRSFGSVRGGGRKVPAYSESRSSIVVLSRPRELICVGHPTSEVINNQLLAVVKIQIWSPTELRTIWSGRRHK